MAKLLDLSGKIDRLPLSLYEILTDVVASIGTRFFVVGATARDVILEQGFGIRSRRATKDVDVGVRLSGWREFHRLKEGLLASGHFTQTRDAQRFLYRDELLVDILPFGEIAIPNPEISWPPEHDVVISVVGIEEAYRAAQTVRVRATPPLDILVATPAGLAIMKTIAWADRPSGKNRDAHDLAHILEKYLDAGNYDRLLEEHDDLVSVENFDYVRAGARLVGRDIAKIGNPETKARVLAILESETDEDSEYRLIGDMIADSAEADEGRDNRFDELLAILRELIAGIKEG